MFSATCSWVLLDQHATAQRPDSDTYFYDPSTKTRTKLPAKVNSEAWEYWPVAWSRHVLFSRLTSRERVLLSDRQTGRLRTIAAMSKKAHIEGTWVGTSSAVYEKCSPKTYVCTIYLWTPGTTTKVPGQAAPWSQYGVDPDNPSRHRRVGDVQFVAKAALVEAKGTAGEGVPCRMSIRQRSS